MGEDGRWKMKDGRKCDGISIVEKGARKKKSALANVLALKDGERKEEEEGVEGQKGLACACIFFSPACACIFFSPQCHIFFSSTRQLLHLSSPLLFSPCSSRFSSHVVKS